MSSQDLERRVAILEGHIESMVRFIDYFYDRTAELESKLQGGRAATVAQPAVKPVFHLVKGGAA